MFGEHLSDLRFRLRALFHRSAVDRELNDELQFHIDREAEKLRAEGVAPDDAMRRARVAFGGVENVREESRDNRGLRWIEIIYRDLRAATRSLRAQPGFTAIAVLSLAIGICMSAGIVTLLGSLYGGGLAFRNTDGIVALYVPRNTGFDYRSYNFKPATMRPLVARSTMVSGIALYASGTVRGRTDTTDSWITAAFVTPSLMSMLGMRPEIGRTFSAADGQPGTPDVAILGHDLWASHFGSDSTIIGRSIELDQRLYTIVGVLPRAMSFPSYSNIWIARSGASLLADTSNYLIALGRLAPGASLGRAGAELTAIARSEPASRPRFSAPPTIKLTPFRDYLASQFSGLIQLLSSIAIVLGLIAAVNFAALVLSRGMRRREELGIRAALGASTARLVTHMLAECVLLGLAGGALGALAAPTVIRGISALIPGLIPPWLHMTWGLRAAAAAIALAVGLGVIFGIAPAVELARPAAAGFLRSGTGGSVGVARQRRGRRLLVSMQVFLAIGPVIFLAMEMGPAWRVHAADPGFDMRGLYTGMAYMSDSDASIRSGTDRDRLLNAVRSTSGVRAAALSVDTYMSSSEIELGTARSGNAVASGASDHTNPWHLVTPEYFDAMHLRLIAGRFPTNDELAHGASVAVASLHSAQALVGGVRTGWRVRLATNGTQPVTLTVVGVVADVVPYGFGNPPFEEFYSSVAGLKSSSYWNASVWVRASQPNAALVSRIYTALHQQDPSVTIIDLQSKAVTIANTMRQMRALLIMVAAAFGIALGLAAVGIYGTIAYAATTRRKEMAIRVALGAARTNVALLVTREAAVQTLIGLVMGTLAAVSGALYMAPGPNWIQTPSVSVIVMSLGSLLAMLVVASIIPIRRVWHLDTASVLREDG